MSKVLLRALLSLTLVACSSGDPASGDGDTAGSGGEEAGEGGTPGVGGAAGDAEGGSGPGGTAGAAGGGEAGGGGGGSPVAGEAGSSGGTGGSGGEPPRYDPGTEENWIGEFGGGAHWNASAADLPPSALNILWHRVLNDVVKDGDWNTYSERNIPAGKGSANLVLVDGKLALIAKDGSAAPSPGSPTGYLTVLDAASGETLNCISIVLNRGNQRVYNWPNLVSMGTDSAPSIAGIAWDPQTKILFTAIGAYNMSYTAYRPLDNVSAFKKGSCQAGVPAYRALFDEHRELQDAFGRSRNELASTVGTNSNPPEPMQPHLWGMSGTYGLSDGVKEDVDWRSLYGAAAKYYNSSSFIRLDPKGDLIGLTIGGGTFGHGGALAALLYSKHSGLKALSKRPETKVLPTPAYPRGAPSMLHPFATRGVILYDGKVYMSGPGDDTFGTARSLADGRGSDQGLYLWAYDYSMHDRKPNDGETGPSAKETADLSLLWTHRFESANTTVSDNNHDSWHEDDGYRRNKAMLVDDGTLWMAWKASKSEGVQLAHAGPEGKEVFDLQVGKGAIGEDFWGKISLARAEGKKYLVYYTGHAKARGRSSGTHMSPRSPAALAVFDVSAKKLLWHRSLSSDQPSLRPNGSWTQIDRSQMVVAGRWAYVAWIDTSASTASLHLLAFDVADAQGMPREKILPLGFPSASHRDSALFDLIAAEGKLYALVYQANELELDSPTPKMMWSAQHVVALGSAK